MWRSGESLADPLLADVDRHLATALNEVIRTITAALDLQSPASRRLAYAHLGWSAESNGPRSFPGKGLRARLCLLSSALTGGDQADAVPAAAAVELVHNFSLIYDDLMDGDTLRRGRPALWAAAGRDAAILTGVDMFAAAVGILAERGPQWAAAARELAVTIQMMVAGQRDDRAMAAEPYQDWSAGSAQRWLSMAEAKTGSLFGCAMALGGLAAGAPPQVVNTFRQAGGKVGVAFQIVDDLMAVNGSETVTGKPRTTAPGANLYPRAQDANGTERCRADSGRHLEEAVELLRSVATVKEVFAYLARLLRSGRDRHR